MRASCGEGAGKSAGNARWEISGCCLLHGEKEDSVPLTLRLICSLPGKWRSQLPWQAWLPPFLELLPVWALTQNNHLRTTLCNRRMLWAWHVLVFGGGILWLPYAHGVVFLVWLPISKISKICFSLEPSMPGQLSGSCRVLDILDVSPAWIQYFCSFFIMHHIGTM